MIEFERAQSKIAAVQPVAKESGPSNSTSAAAAHSQIGGFFSLNSLDVGIRRSTSLPSVTTESDPTGASTFIIPSNFSQPTLTATSEPDSSSANQSPPETPDAAAAEAREAVRARSVAKLELKRYLLEPREVGARVTDLVRYWEVSISAFMTM